MEKVSHYNVSDLSFERIVNANAGYRGNERYEVVHKGIFLGEEEITTLLSFTVIDNLLCSSKVMQSIKVHVSLNQKEINFLFDKLLKKYKEESEHYHRENPQAFTTTQKPEDVPTAEKLGFQVAAECQTYSYPKPRVLMFRPTPHKNAKWLE